MGHVGDDKHTTNIIILYCRVSSGTSARCRCWCANRGKGVDLLVAGPRSAVIVVDRLKFLYEGYAVDEEASDGELWCWRDGCKITLYFCGSSGACRSMVNGRMWVSKNILSTVVPQ
jgi:hypothetical protein